jgi:hypothetical protein
LILDPKTKRQEPRPWKLGAIALAVTFYAAPSSAQDPTASFISEDACLAKSKPCNCMDLPSMQDFHQNQKDALDAWDQTATDIQSGKSGAKTAADARAIFSGHFASATEAKIAMQFQSCPGYDPAKDSLTKVAGLHGISPVFSPCFCSAFCQDIVASTAAHEKMHVKVNIGVLPFYIDLLAACKLGIASQAVCDMVEPMTLTTSEIFAHQAGIESLDASIKKIKASPMTECMMPTILPLVPPDPMPPKQRPPAGFGDRLRLLFGRMLHGAGG